ncbi:MAG TPA: DeoR/GlpR family DNA-binding transcription regulator [Clostridia bacterium]|nr:DeoR/GlpR family DNA-binding transcription regulator [Clostridia bacterium]
MSKSLDSRAARHNKIRNLLITNKLLNVDEFCEILHCSEATIRNDLRYLEEQGFIKRTYGGAVATENTTYNTDVILRTSVLNAEKQAIADYVVRNILTPGQIITLDSGSTNAILAQKIVESQLELTAITNSLISASILAKSQKVNLYVVGGYYNMLTYSFQDEITQKILETVRSDIFFLAPNGVSSQAGITITDPKEVNIKQMMIKHANRSIALADHSKVGKSGFKVICNLNDLNMLVTDDKSDVNEITRLKGASLPVVVVPA